MNAYYHFHAQDIAKETAALNQRRHAPQRSKCLTQVELLNSAARQHVSPHSKDFWTKLTDWLTATSKQAEGLPKARRYRRALEPYLLRRVRMTAGTWSFREIRQDKVRLLLKDVRLTHVHGGTGDTPDVAVDHMNIWVSPAWLDCVGQARGEPLVLDGLLHEYASAAWKTRNIGFLPVLMMPKNWENCAAGPDFTQSPGIAA